MLIDLAAYPTVPIAQSAPPAGAGHTYPAAAPAPAQPQMPGPPHLGQPHPGQPHLGPAAVPAPPPGAASGVKVQLVGLGPAQWVSCCVAVLGLLSLYLAMVFNWHTYTIAVRFLGARVSTESPVSFGTLLTTDLEQTPFAGFPADNFNTSHASYADVLAILYLVLSVGLVGLVIGSFLARGVAQTWLRVAGVGAAMLSVACVALLAIDLARVAEETESALRSDLSGGGSELTGGFSLTVQPTFGPGMVLAVIACMLLGVAAVLAGPVRRATRHQPYPGPAGHPYAGVPVGHIELGALGGPGATAYQHPGASPYQHPGAPPQAHLGNPYARPPEV
ncbi:MAG: hypothetical protein ACRDTQ_11325 [Micromonosporaceae bacterium]